MEIQRKRWLSFTIIPIVLFYLCEFRFFYLLPLPNKLFAGSTNKNLLAVFSLFAFCYFLVRVKKFTWGQFGAVFLLIFAVVKQDQQNLLICLLECRTSCVEVERVL